MQKVMLVEDDNNLREIYEARLQAEGYNIVSARDGEEALVVAKAERPDLIISDVMMPKISGFEMLDILRNTDGLKDVKVIMLTALGQSDDQQRADRLGADRYLVKSQVTLEDIVRVAHELLSDQPAHAGPDAPAADLPDPTPVATPDPDPTPAPESATAATTPTVVPVVNEPADTATNEASPVAAVDATAPQSEAQEEAEVEAKIEDFVAGAPEDTTATESAAPTVETTAEPEATQPVLTEATPEPGSADKPGPGSVPIAHKIVVEPLDNAPKKDLDTLLALEEAQEASAAKPAEAPKPVVGSDDSQPSSESGNEKIDPHNIAL